MRGQLLEHSLVEFAKNIRGGTTRKTAVVPSDMRDSYDCRAGSQHYEAQECDTAYFTDGSRYLSICPRIWTLSLPLKTWIALEKHLCLENGSRLVQLLQHESSCYYFVLADRNGETVRFIPIDAAVDYRRDGFVFVSAQSFWPTVSNGKACRSLRRAWSSLTCW